MALRLIYLSDLLLLRDLLSPDCENIAVFDPSDRLIATHNRKFELLKEPLFVPIHNTLMFDLSTFFIGTHLDDDYKKWSYINNPDGSIRWIYEKAKHNSNYLSLYNSGTLKGKIYQRVSKIAHIFHLGQMLSSGEILVQQKLVESVKKNYEIGLNEELSFFTGTRGATRKIVAEVHDGNKTKAFIKIPVTDISKQLVNNEAYMLKELSKYDFTTLSLPKVSKQVSGSARLSNIKPAVTIPADRITAIHTRALAEIYAISHERKRINESAAWKAICSNMEYLKSDYTYVNHPTVPQSAKIVQLLRKLYLSINEHEQIAVSVSHGDFTPWNMYCDEQRLYVYDWELAQNGIPMLFDLYHFTFQTCILQQRKDFLEVRKQINKWLEHSLVQQLIHKYRIQSETNYKIYLLFTVSHYLRQYLGERELLLQSEWMLNCWTAALEEITSKESFKKF